MTSHYPAFVYQASLFLTHVFPPKPQFPPGRQCQRPDWLIIAVIVINTAPSAGGSNALVARIYRRFSTKARAKRLADFVRLLQPRAGERILDIGGYQAGWTACDFAACSVDLVNIDGIDDAGRVTVLPNGLRLRAMKGDGCDLEFEDGSYDIVFSNSVIEHVGDSGAQAAFAKEALRVGKRLWIQTPAMICPIEPHFLGLGIHWFPRRLRPLAARLLSIRGLLGGHSRAHLQELVDTTRLIPRSRLKMMFPGCRIVTERILGFIPKSYIVISDARPSDNA